MDTVSQITQLWRDVDALVEAGKLTPKANRLCEVHDVSVLESIGAICKQIDTSAGPDKPTRIKLMRQNKKLISVADHHTV